ncbi:DUF6415 family natural product biosynthesis protein [Streptomyces sp. bgisy027]|uniref:DUF6415 family natural product biosynthesis protein n=1 Tax=Streptomyces sp. bgisy027 TaxID=3413770 RepID=UPI003D718744
MRDSGPVPIDAKTIRKAYTDVLWEPFLPTAAELDKTCEQLAGHVGLLIPEVMGLAARMRSERSGMRAIAIHCLVRAHQTLATDPAAGSPVRAHHLYDLATTVRALLTLWEHPGPLGEPTGKDEIEAAVRRRICGGCCEPIEDGEGFEEAVFLAESSGGIRGYRHTDSCAVLAAQRRRQLRAV